MRIKWPVGDLQARLDRTFIRYDDLVYYCRVDGTHLLLYRPMDVNGSKPKFINVNKDDEKLDVSSIPLGYMNYNGNAVYLRRSPTRRYKQGVCPGSLSDGQNGDILFTKEFSDSIEGIFPSLRQAIALFNKQQAVSVALTQNVAIGLTEKYYKVYIQEEEVGYIEKNNNVKHPVVNIPPENFSWVVSFYLSQFDWTIN